MTRPGIFLPLADHVVKYCETDEFVSCRHYQKGCEVFLQEAEQRGLVFNGGRRRYPRVTSQVSVSLAHATVNNSTSELIDDDAVTLDFSLGGMRVRTSKPLPAEQTVSFTFGREFLPSVRQGLGQIRWSQECADGKSFELGVAFLEFRISEAVVQHLGLNI